MKNIILLLSALFPILVNAGPAGCPSYDPPTTTLAPINFGAPPNTAGSADQYCVELKPRLGSMLDSYTFDHSTVTTNGSGTCYWRNNSSGSVMAYGTFAYYTVCPAGYVKASNHSYSLPLCNLSNVQNVECPPVSCTAGKSLGFGSSDSASGAACFAGCEIGFKGLTAAQKDVVDGHVGQYTGEFEQNGNQCTEATNPPPAPDPYGPNCVTNGSSSLCINNVKPGCGLLNGKEFCADELPSNGACIFVGSSGYVCGGSNTPPPAPNNEPPPVPLFPIAVPVQDPNGLPPNGAPPAANGGVPGPGQMPGTAGTYPGPSGSGVKTGTGDVDLSGIAQESTLQTVRGFLQSIKDSLTGTFSGNTFSWSNHAPWTPIDKSVEIAAAKDELANKIGTIRTEFQSLLTFHPSGVSGGALVCPPGASFSFLGSSISLCSQEILSATANLGDVLIFGFAVVCLFILLS